MKKAYEYYQNELSAIREAGTYKDRYTLGHVKLVDMGKRSVGSAG